MRPSVTSGTRAGTANGETSAARWSRPLPGRRRATTISRVPERDSRPTARDRVRAPDRPPVEAPNATGLEGPRHRSWLNAQTGQLLPQGADGAKHTRFDRADWQSKGVSNLCIGPLLYEGERGNHVQLGRQPAKGDRDGFAHAGIRGWRRRNLVVDRAAPARA